MLSLPTVNANLTSYTSASITPTANRLVLAAIKGSVDAGAGTNPTPTLSGNGLTWVQVATIESAAGVNGVRTAVFRALGASPSVGAVTIDFGGVTQNTCSWSIVEFSGIDTSGTNGSGAVVQSKTAGATTGTTGTADFDNAFGDATNNATYSALASRTADAGIAPEAGFTELHDQSGIGRLETMWRIGEDQTPAPTWTTSAQWAQVIVEIKIASAGDQTLTGALFASATTWPTGTLTQPAGSAITVSGTTVTVTTPGTVTITGPGGVVYSGGSATITLPVGAYTWTSTDGPSGAFTVTAGSPNRMGGSGAIRKPPRNVGR